MKNNRKILIAVISVLMVAICIVIAALLSQQPSENESRQTVPAENQTTGALNIVDNDEQSFTIVAADGATGQIEKEVEINSRKIIEVSSGENVTGTISIAIKDAYGTTVFDSTLDSAVFLSTPPLAIGKATVAVSAENATGEVTIIISEIETTEDDMILSASGDVEADNNSNQNIENNLDNSRDAISAPLDDLPNVPRGNTVDGTYSNVQTNVSFTVPSGVVLDNDMVTPNTIASSPAMELYAKRSGTDDTITIVIDNTERLGATDLTAVNEIAHAQANEYLRQGNTVEDYSSRKVTIGGGEYLATRLQITDKDGKQKIMEQIYIPSGENTTVVTVTAHDDDALSYLLAGFEQ